MTTGRSELVRLHFGGEPYAGGALDAGALRTVLQFQKIVTEAARAVWKVRHPARERVPKGFDERTQLSFAAIEAGSVSIRLAPRSPDPTPLLDAPTVMEEAVRLTSETLGAANRDEPPPRGVPMHVVRVCQGLGRDLPAGARFSFTSPNRPTTIVSDKTRAVVRSLMDQPYPDSMDLEGRVLEADVHRWKFQLWTDDGRCIPVRFTRLQEAVVTKALKEHRVARIRVTGRGRFEPMGALTEVTLADSITLVDDGRPSSLTDAPAIQARIAEIFSDVPDEEWEKLPSDLSARLNHYIYGVDDT